MKKILLFALFSLSLLAVVSAQAYSCPMGSGGFVGGYGNMMYGGYGTGAMLIGWLIGLAILVALVLLIVWLVKQIGKKK